MQMLPNDIISLILSHLLWEEDSDELLKVYPFSEIIWRSYTSFKLELTNNSTKYLVNDIFHRSDGPAIIETRDRVQYVEWYQAGKLHRLNGPAISVTFPNNSYSLYCYYMGKLHNNGGPAIVHMHKHYTHEEYYDMGERHRINGPAIIISCNVIDINVFEQYWINNKVIKTISNPPW
jgi:hypothetical protein